MVQQDRGKRAVEALKKRGFSGPLRGNPGPAKEMILKEIPSGATVGVGGSVTVRGMGVLEELKAKGHKVLRPLGNSPFRGGRVLSDAPAQQTSDVFLTSSNAITLEGQLVNTDGSGNRVNAMTFGPRKAIVVAGSTKSSPTWKGPPKDQGNWRPHELQTPPINPPLYPGREMCGLPGPPAGLSHHFDHRMEAPFFSDYLVIIIGEELGF